MRMTEIDPRPAGDGGRAGCRLDDVLITDALAHRPARAPDHRMEADAMARLAEELANRPDRLLQTLCEGLVEDGIAGSAGISLLEAEKGGGQFEWIALAGAWARHRGGVMPIDASPCGIVVARRAMQLFENPARFFGHAEIAPPVHELLLMPFFHQGTPIGTVWIVAHDADRRFDQEDGRLLERLSRFAAAGFQMTRALRAARISQSELEARVEERSRALRESEERQIFLLQLSDALRAETSVAGVARCGLAMLAERLSLDRCYIADFALAEDRVDVVEQIGNARTAPLPASLRLSDFPQAACAAFEQTLVMADIAASPSLSEAERANFADLGIGALAAVVLHKGRDEPIWSLGAITAHARSWPRGEIALIEDVAERIWTAMEQVFIQATLRDSEERLRSAVEVGRLGLWDWDVVTNEVHWSDEHFRMEGYAVGEVKPGYDSWVARVHPDDRPGAEAILNRAMTEHREFDHEFRVVHPDGSIHWLHGRGRFFYGEGEPVRMVGAVVETTDRRMWEERQQVLIAELQHRTRNLIGVVRSTAEKTARSSTDLAEFQEKFEDRLDALSRVQGLLSRLNEHDRVTFGDLIRTELSALGGGGPDRVTLDGPPGVRLRSSTVQTLAMALHELGTNAAKYGALAHATGHLTVRWSLEPAGADDRPWLHIDWRESGVPMPPAGSAPQGTGQGRELIERALPYQLSARTTYRLEADGVHCTIAIPVSACGADRGDTG